MTKVKWEHYATCTDGDCILFGGINLFDYEWNDTGERIKIKDPQYKRTYLTHIYSICVNEKIIKFAAEEFSNCVWGIFIQK